MESIFKKQCPKCKMEAPENVYFCSNCGYSLRSKPINTSILKQVIIYFVSFFLAPFGLGFAFKYLKQLDKKSRQIGIISLVLTFLGIVTVIFVAKRYLEQEYGLINLISNGGL